MEAARARVVDHHAGERRGRTGRDAVDVEVVRVVREDGQGHFRAGAGEVDVANVVHHLDLCDGLKRAIDNVRVAADGDVVDAVARVRIGRTRDAAGAHDRLAVRLGHERRDDVARDGEVADERAGLDLGRVVRVAADDVLHHVAAHAHVGDGRGGLQARLEVVDDRHVVQRAARGLDAAGGHGADVDVARESLRDHVRLQRAGHGHDRSHVRILDALIRVGTDEDEPGLDRGRIDIGVQPEQTAQVARDVQPAQAAGQRRRAFVEPDHAAEVEVGRDRGGAEVGLAESHVGRDHVREAQARDMAVGRIGGRVVGKLAERGRQVYAVRGARRQAAHVDRDRDVVVVARAAARAGVGLVVERDRAGREEVVLIEGHAARPRAHAGRVERQARAHRVAAAEEGRVAHDQVVVQGPADVEVVQGGVDIGRAVVRIVEVAGHDQLVDRVAGL